MRHATILLTCIVVQSLLAQSVNLLPYRLGDQWGFVDESNQIKIQPEYDSVGFMHTYPGNMSGVAKVWKKGNAGLIDAQGKVLIKPTYENIFLNEYHVNLDRKFGGVIVMKNGKYGILNTAFETQIKPNFDTLFFKEVHNQYGLDDFAYFGKQKGSFYSLNEKFEMNEMKPALYANLMEQVKRPSRKKEIHSPLAEELDSTYYKLEQKIPEFVERNLDSINRASTNPISSKVVQVYCDEKVGLVFSDQLYQEKISHYILPPVYDEIVAFQFYKTGIPYNFLARVDGKIALINDHFDVVLEPKYENYSRWDSEGLYLLHKGKHGFFRMADGLLIQPKYEQIKLIEVNEKTFFEVMQNGKKGYLLENGTELFSESVQN